LYCLSVLCDFWLTFCHCIVCLSFSLTSGYLFGIVLSVCPRQTIQWQKDNQKSQRTDRQYNGKKITRSQREGQYLFAVVLSVCPLWLLVIFLPLHCLSVLLQWQKDNQKSQRRTDRQYNDKKITRSHREGQTDNTMASVLLCDFWLSFCHCIVCLSCDFWLSFCHCKDRQTIQWQKDNQKSQRTDRQYNGKKITRSQREWQTDNTMAKSIVLSVCPLWLLVNFLPLYCLSVLLFDFWLSFCHCIEKDRQRIQWQKDNQKSQRTDRQYNGKKITRSHILFDFWLSFCHCIVCLSSLTSSYLFAIVLSVCPYLWPLVIVLPLYCRKKITRSQREGQTHNTMAKR
jgi:hypothetical protein